MCGFSPLWNQRGKLSCEWCHCLPRWTKRGEMLKYVSWLELDCLQNYLWLRTYAFPQSGTPPNQEHIPQSGTHLPIRNTSLNQEHVPQSGTHTPIRNTSLNQEHIPQSGTHTPIRDTSLNQGHTPQSGTHPPIRDIPPIRDTPPNQGHPPNCLPMQVEISIYHCARHWNSAYMLRASLYILVHTHNNNVPDPLLTTQQAQRVHVVDMAPTILADCHSKPRVHPS